MCQLLEATVRKPALHLVMFGAPDGKGIVNKLEKTR